MAEASLSTLAMLLGRVTLANPEQLTGLLQRLLPIVTLPRTAAAEEVSTLQCQHFRGPTLRAVGVDGRCQGAAMLITLCSSVVSSLLYCHPDAKLHLSAPVSLAACAGAPGCARGLRGAAGERHGGAGDRRDAAPSGERGGGVAGRLRLVCVPAGASEAAAYLIIARLKCSCRLDGHATRLTLCLDANRVSMDVEFRCIMYTLFFKAFVTTCEADSNPHGYDTRNHVRHTAGRSGGGGGRRDWQQDPARGRAAGAAAAGGRSRGRRRARLLRAGHRQRPQQRAARRWYELMRAWKRARCLKYSCIFRAGRDCLTIA